jgi:hypothetical protein
MGVQAASTTIMSNMLHTSVALLLGKVLPLWVVLLPDMVLPPGMVLPHDVVCCWVRYCCLIVCYFAIPYKTLWLAMSWMLLLMILSILRLLLLCMVSTGLHTSVVRTIHKDHETGLIDLAHDTGCGIHHCRFGDISG